MTASERGTKLREHTAAIRHLDATRARRLVALFTRPAVLAGDGIAYDDRDPATAETWGQITLDQPPARHASAAVVGHYRTHLYLHELLRLPLSVARELARHRGHLYLDKLESITDAVAAELATHAGGGLSLNNLRRLSAAAARSLGRRGGELSLNGLRTLDPAAALGLAAHENELHLWGLEHLSPAAAAALAQHRGDLFLEGLANLSDQIACHLARHRGKLHVHRITSLSDAAAAAFGSRQGYLCLRGVRRLSPLQALLLCRHQGPLLFDALELDDVVAACLSRHEGSLALNLRRGITLPQLESLAQHVGQLSLTGLSTLDERQAGVLAAQANWRGVPGLSGLFLDHVTHVAPAQAKILATHRAGGLSLKGITCLTAETARELVRHPLLCLDGVTRVSDRVAAILADHSGATLSLKGLRDVGPAALVRLQRNPGIELPRRLCELPAPRAGRPPQETRGNAPPQDKRLVVAIRQIAARGEEALQL